MTKIALGIFDGVHLGHQKVIEKAHWVVTFHPHPSFALKHDSDMRYLTTLSERKILIGNLAVIKFNRRLAQKSAERFVKDILVKRFHPTEVIVGFDFCFGKNREGNVKTLTQLGRKFGFKVTVIPPYRMKGTPVKSSVIRNLLDEGQIEKANVLLGREYFVTGKVVKGLGRGRKIGFPTANVKADIHKLIPGCGVYAGSAIVNNQSYPAAINIGNQPTFNDGQYQMEAHLLNYNGPKLYGKPITIIFEKFIRPEQKFKSVVELKRQIKKDVAKVG
jgi:riboflavin kinase/FMN adenylyltransferase